MDWYDVVKFLKHVQQNDALVTAILSCIPSFPDILFGEHAIRKIEEKPSKVWSKIGTVFGLGVNGQWQLRVAVLQKEVEVVSDAMSGTEDLMRAIGFTLVFWEMPYKPTSIGAMQNPAYHVAVATQMPQDGVWNDLNCQLEIHWQTYNVYVRHAKH